MIVDTNYLYTFISTGELTKMYTLRIMSHDKCVVGGESFFTYNSYYVQNLSTEWDVAVEKARELSEGLNLTFKEDAEFDLKEIRRLNAEQSQARREAIQRDIEEREMRAKSEFEQNVAAGIVLVGKYEGRGIQEVWDESRGYVWWLVDCVGASGKLGISAEVAKRFVEEHGYVKPEYVGEVGGEIVVTLKLRYGKWTQGRFQTLMWVCEAPEGEEVVFFSTAKAFKELKDGDIFTVKALVKEHREGWNGNKQTVLNKPKIVK